MLIDKSIGKIYIASLKKCHVANLYTTCGVKFVITNMQRVNRTPGALGLNIQSSCSSCENPPRHEGEREERQSASY